MKRVKGAGWLALASLAIVLLMLCSPGSAQVAVRLVAPDGQAYDVTGRNMPRGDEALILYDKTFGQYTRTNAFGVEVIATPSERPNLKTEDGRPYEVKAVTSVWDCQAHPEKAAACGNAEIPSNGIVLSATGTRRDVLKKFKTGDILLVQEEWFHQKQANVSVVNPSPLTNPAGSGFPGFRASNQLIIYDADYGRPSTGTNEFGFEVTVQNGIVTAQEGSDSAIPPDGFVISGHGKGRSWLINHAPLGAKIQFDPATYQITTTVDFDTYVYQFERYWQESPCMTSFQATTHAAAVDKLCQEIAQRKGQAMQLAASGRESLAVSTLLDSLESLKRRLWVSYQPFPGTTVRGAWHRPVEKDREAIGRTLDYLKNAGLNTVFLETFFHGYTIFPSQTYADYGLPNQNPKFAGTDILALWVEEAHQRDMRIHVWFQTFYAGTKAFMPPGPILEKYPEWANVQHSALIPEKLPESFTKPNGNGIAKTATNHKTKGQKTGESTPVKLLSPEKPVPSTLELGGYFLDPMNPAVQNFLLKLSEEIVTRYPVDGFQLDYIRYPASFPADRFSYRKTTWGYSDLARNAFKARYGADPAEINPKDPKLEELWAAWNTYKTEQVNRFVEKTTRSLRQKRPDLQISAAVFPEVENALLLKHQDWLAWARNGWVDFFAPMTLTSAIKVVERDTRYMVSATGGKVPVFSGLFGPFNNNSAEHLLSQIDTAKNAGASGYVLFDTAHLTNRMMEALKIVQVPAPVVQEAPPTKPTPSTTSEQQAPTPKKKRWWRRAK